MIWKVILKVEVSISATARVNGDAGGLKEPVLSTPASSEPPAERSLCPLGAEAFWQGEEADPGDNIGQAFQVNSWKNHTNGQ